MVKKKPKLPVTFGVAGRPRKFTLEEVNVFANELLEWLKDPLHIWFKDFCLDKDLNPDFMAEWAEESEIFRGAYTQAKARQESRLVNGGLTGGFNSAITKLVLNHSHDWIEKQEIKTTDIAPNEELNAARHEIMILKAKLDNVESQIKNKSEAE